MNKPTMKPPAVAAVLTSAGGIPVSESSVERDVQLGAPAEEDGSINLIEYAAWLIRQIARRS